MADVKKIEVYSSIFWAQRRGKCERQMTLSLIVLHVDDKAYLLGTHICMLNLQSY